MEENEFVDIHGRQLRTVSGKDDEILFYLTDLKPTGFGIFHKSKYEKLKDVDTDFDRDFIEYLLNEAASFMLTNKVKFTEDQIIDSIENTKHTLREKQCDNKTVNQPTEKNAFFKSRKVEAEYNNQTLSKSQNMSTLQLETRRKNSFSSPQKPQTPETVVNNSNNLHRQFPVKGTVNRSLQSPDESNTRRFSANAVKGNTNQKRTDKRLVYNAKTEELDVVVTSIDKPNCVWVRDLAKIGLFEQIYEKISQEASHAKKVSPKFWQFDKMYMARDEDSWFRCRILKKKPLTVHFVDYGNIAEVVEVREVSEELSKIPCLAVRITFVEKQLQLKLEDEIRIKPFSRNDDGTFFVNVLDSLRTTRRNNCDFEDDWNTQEPINTRSQRSPLKSQNEWDCESVHSQNSDSKTPRQAFSFERNLSFNQRNVGPKSEKNPSFETNRGNVPAESDWTSASSEKSENSSEPVFFSKPPPLCKLEDAQKVVIVQEKSGELFLRTKECFAKLKEIGEEISTFSQSVHNLSSVKLGQLVLYECPKERKIYRAVVGKITGNKYEIEMLDYVNTVVAELSDLKNINEKLGLEGITYLSAGKLQGFEGGFSKKQKEFIDDCISKNTKFTVVIDFDDEVDLHDGSELLSKRLKNVSETSSVTDKSTGKVTLKDIKPFKAATGTNTYVCGFYKSSTELALVPSDELQQHIDYILRTEIEDSVSYSPTVGEVCLCYFVDYWYRCLVLQIFNRQYEVLLLDFGSTELVNKADMRKPDPQVTVIPALAMPCVLTDLPPHGNVEDLLRKYILNGEVYSVDVKKIVAGKCHVEIPCVYKKIREL